VAFMHRPSAQSDPISPLGHHWQDATHISYGVATAGVYSRLWQLEGSIFNGREPDENRWDFDFATLDSYSGRLTANPSGRWSVAGWYGFLKSPEALHPDEYVRKSAEDLVVAGAAPGAGVRHQLTGCGLHPRDRVYSSWYDRHRLPRLRERHSSQPGADVRDSRAVGNRGLRPRAAEAHGD